MNDESRRRVLPRLVPATVGGHLAAVLVPAVAILLLAAVAVGWAALKQHSQANEAAQHFKSATLTEGIETNWLYADALTARYFSSPTNNVRVAVQEKEAQVSGDLSQLLVIEMTFNGPDELARVNDAIAQAAAMEGVRGSVINAVDRGDLQTAGVLLAQQTQDSGPGLSQLQDQAADEHQQILDLGERSSHTATLLAFAVGGVVFAIILLGLIATVVIARSVVRPLSHLRKTARAIGEGDLNIRAQVSGPREVRDLASVVNLMAESVAQRESALRASETYWRSVIQNSQNIITVFNTDFSIAYQSPAGLRILGYTEQEMIEMGALKRIHPDDAAAAQESLVYALSHPGEATSVEYRIQKKNGEWRTLEATSSRVDNPGQKPMIMVSARDVTESKEAAQTIVHMAFHDALTGLAQPPPLH